MQAVTERMAERSRMSSQALKFKLAKVGWTHQGPKADIWVRLFFYSGVTVMGCVG